MFCTNCGKQIIDTARFCNFCGMAIAQKTENAQSVTQPTTPASIPAEQSVTVSENQPVSSVSIEQTEQTEQAEQSVQTQQAESIAVSVPQAVDSPKEGMSPVISAVSPSAPSAPLTAPAQPVQPIQPVQSTQPTTSAQFVQPQAAASNAVPQSANTATPVNNQPSPKTERAPRMYTAGHIIMCLASTAIMAIVAGIFAGLYFSVV